MKSVYYTAVITRAYRKAIDLATGNAAGDLAAYRDEVFKVSHREFSTGFYFDDPAAVQPNLAEYAREYIFLGTVGEKREEDVFVLEVKNTINAGEKIEYVGPDILYIEDDGYTLLDESFSPSAKAHHGGVSYIKTGRPVKPGYLIRRKVL